MKIHNANLSPYARRKIIAWRCQKRLTEFRRAALEAMPEPDCRVSKPKPAVIVTIKLPATGERVQMTIHRTPWPGKLAWQGHVESGRKIGQRIGVLLAEAI